MTAFQAVSSSIEAVLDALFLIAVSIVYSFYKQGNNSAKISLIFTPFLRSLIKSLFIFTIYSVLLTYCGLLGLLFHGLSAGPVLTAR
jgi:hypothetical protein